MKNSKNVVENSNKRAASRLICIDFKNLRESAGWMNTVLSKDVPSFDVFDYCEC